MSDVSKATRAIIELIAPMVSSPSSDSADKIYYTLGSVMDYPNVEHADKLSVINGVTRYLIKNCGVDSPLTKAALTISAENNDILN